MTTRRYDPAEETECLYCSKQYKTPLGLKKHVQTKHAGSYRANAYDRDDVLSPPGR